MFILDPRSEFSIPDHGSRVKKISDPRTESATKNLSIFNQKNCFQDLGNTIRDIHPGSGSRIKGVKKYRIPDQDPQHCVQVYSTKSLRIVNILRFLVLAIQLLVSWSALGWSTRVVKVNKRSKMNYFYRFSQ